MRAQCEARMSRDTLASASRYAAPSSLVPRGGVGGDVGAVNIERGRISRSRWTQQWKRETGGGGGGGGYREPG